MKTKKKTICVFLISKLWLKRFTSKSFHQLNKIERLTNESEFNHENNKRFVVGIKKILEFL